MHPVRYSRLPDGQRRLLQAVTYETGAIAIVGPLLAAVFARPLGDTLTLAVVMSVIAVAWNFAFNALFEAWERRRQRHVRSLALRLAHGLGFEGGLTLVLVPLTAWWIDIPWWNALLADLGLLGVFYVYTVGFTWLFDRVVGLPRSLQPTADASDSPR